MLAERASVIMPDLSRELIRDWVLHDQRQIQTAILVVIAPSGLSVCRLGQSRGDPGEGAAVVAPQIQPITDQVFCYNSRHLCIISLEDKRRQQVQACIDAGAEGLASSLDPTQIGQKLYLTGETARAPGFVPALQKILSIECERIDYQPGAGWSATTLGLRRLWEKNGTCPQLVFQIQEDKRRELTPEPVRWRWAALAGLLLLTSFSLRYAEPLLWKERLSRRLGEINSQREGLPKIDRELAFLQNLEENQSPFIGHISVAVLWRAGLEASRDGSFSVPKVGQ